MPLSPEEAANLANEQVTVEMLVKAAKNYPHCSQVFLDSEEDHHDPKNLAVAVTETGPFRFTAPAAFVLPSAHQEEHGDEGQRRSLPKYHQRPEGQTRLQGADADGDHYTSNPKRQKTVARGVLVQ